MPFFASHNVSAFFWPDLASCHYSKKTTEWYKLNSIDFVARDSNPPNCPELRPVERYWALCKRELKNTKKVTTDIKDFKQKWTTSSKKVEKSTIKNLMEGLPEKVKNFHRV